MTPALDALWGAILDDVSLDIISQAVTLVVRVPRADQETTHHLVAHGVHECRFTNSGVSHFGGGRVVRSTP
jgi:hypothetical protein